MRKIILLLLALLTSFSTLTAQTPQSFNKPKMDSLMAVLSSKNKAMLSLSILKDGKQLYSEAIGIADQTGGTNLSATSKSKYRIGSISKVFTAAMIFQLIEEGKLKQSTTLSTFFPDVTNAAKITISHLLNHSSGLFNFTNDTGYAKMESKQVTQAQQLTQFKRAPVFEPGAKHEYSNTNYVLLGYIIEKIDQQPYSVSLKKRITDKINLTKTYYGGKINVANQEVHSFTWANEWKRSTETNMSIPGGAGAIVSTSDDIGRFFDALFNGQLITSASLEHMKTIQNGFGKGLFTIPFYEMKGFGHNGGIDAFQSVAVYFPEQKLSVAILANGLNMMCNDILIAALKIISNRPYQIPDFKELKLQTTDLDKYLGVYAAGNFPLKITIAKKNAVLYAQATGQSAIPLVGIEPDIFTYEAANILLKFAPAKQQMTLKQGPGTYVLQKENN